MCMENDEKNLSAVNFDFQTLKITNKLIDKQKFNQLRFGQAFLKKKVTLFLFSYSFLKGLVNKIFVLRSLNDTADRNMHDEYFWSPFQILNFFNVYIFGHLINTFLLLNALFAGFKQLKTLTPHSLRLLVVRISFVYTL